jgi:toxin FitB
VSERGGRPRRRATALAAAATTNMAGVPLVTHNVADFHLISDLVQVQGISGGCTD